MQIQDGFESAFPHSRHIAILAIFFLFPVWAIGANISNNDANNFTEDERHEFQEMPNRFHKKILPHLIPYGALAWIDNQHIIMSVNEIPGVWNADTMPVPLSLLSPIMSLPPKGMERIIIVDVNSGDIADALYQGELACYADGQIIIGVREKFGEPNEYYAGTYGTKLTRLENYGKGNRPRALSPACSIPEKDEKFITHNLLANHGKLRVTKSISRDPGTITPLYLLDKENHLIATIAARADAKPHSLRYLSYANQYVAENIMNERTDHAGMMLSPDGNFSYLVPDPFLMKMILQHPSNSNAVVEMAKIGLFWNFVPSPHFWREQGLYFRENGKTLRLDDVEIGALVTSPDGCKLLYRRQSGNPNFLRNSSSQELVVMQLCDK